MKKINQIDTDKEWAEALASGDIETLKALEVEAYENYKAQVRRCANSHDDFFKWKERKEQLDELLG